jgi:hypothetical protein
MNDKHPITPPPELVYEWKTQASHCGNTTAVIQAIARWGADQELEACCEWLTEQTCFHPESDLIKDLRAARRPKPPSLKEQALYALDAAEYSDCLHLNGLGDTIRRALEALPND